MALVTCPDCGAEHSDAAAACPKCARPAKSSYLQREGESAVKMVKGLLVGLMVIIVLLAVFSFLSVVAEGM